MKGVTQTKQIVGGVTAGVLTVFPIWLFQLATANKPHTMSPKWKSAEYEKMRFQGMNRIREGW